MLLTISYRLEQLYLGRTEIFRIILKHRGIDIQYLLETEREHFFRHLGNRKAPNKIAQLLQIPGMTLHHIANPAGKRFRNSLAGLLKR